MIRIIAEIGSVHDGSFGNAIRLIEAAASCGADTVKFQTHIAEAETLINAPSPTYFNEESRFEYFQRTSFTLEQWNRLLCHARELGVSFLSSPFSIEAVDLLEKVGVDAYKIPSGEVTNTPLLERIAKTHKPVIISSGMSSWSELDLAVSVVKDDCFTTVMQCSSIYPCPPEKVGLNIIREMRARYGLPVGYSDHTLGFAAPIAAASLGASIIEKHFTFSRRMYGSDAKNSMEPDEFSIMKAALYDVWKMLDNPVNKDDLTNYIDQKRIFEKSIVTSRCLNENDVLTIEMLSFKKPGDGMPARDYAKIIGKRICRNLPKDHKISEDDLF